ncbi:YVTN repeat-like/Quino protein amine dehydrogenase [Lipomyces orientalis]|uniref:YVTN repeat-like/Quino protein amine dehydrogenase n=1 Tax=Lipomyces orientalis TaxID=1233043 RepID=A0ACC3TH17_9ASCO
MSDIESSPPVGLFPDDEGRQSESMLGIGSSPRHYCRISAADNRDLFNPTTTNYKQDCFSCGFFSSLLRDDSFSIPSTMKPSLFLLLLPVAVLADVSYRRRNIVPWEPKNATSVDQSVINHGTYYLSDRTNNVVHVVDIASGTLTTDIKGFVGVNLVNGKPDNAVSGPNGLLVIPDRNELYVGDGDGTVKVVDLRNNTVVASIHTGSVTRADELAYDAKRQLIAVTNPEETTAKIAIISVADRKVLGNVTFPNATNGVEQPAWNTIDGYIYVSVPETTANPGGEIDVVDPEQFEIIKVLPEPECNSHGIVFGPNQQLLLGCSQDSILTYGTAHVAIMDIRTGNITSTINGVAGADQVVYDPTANLYYVSAYQNTANGTKQGMPDPILAIIDAATGDLVQTIPTDNVTAHSVAVDPKTNTLVVPLANIGITIFDLIDSTNSTGSPTGTDSSGAPRTELLLLLYIAVATFTAIMNF